MAKKIKLPQGPKIRFPKLTAPKITAPKPQKLPKIKVTSFGRMPRVTGKMPKL